MNCCYEIYIIDVPADVPETFLIGGQLKFDTEGGLTYTSNAEERSEISKLKGDALKSITLPQTPKNDYILTHFKDLALYMDDYSPIKVAVLDDGIPLVVDRLEIAQTQGSYQGQLLNSDSFWKVKAEDVMLNDIDLGEFTFSLSNIQAQSAAFRYIDGQPPVYFPHIDYGWFPESFYPYRRLRPLIAPLPLLKAIFCNLGYDFESPILESLYFRDMWWYLLDPKFGEYKDKGKGGLGVRASQNGQKTYVYNTLELTTNTGDYDVSNSYNETDARFYPFKHVGIGGYNVEIKANISSLSTNGDGNGFAVEHYRRIAGAVTGTLWEKIETKKIEFKAGSTPAEITFNANFGDFRIVDGYPDRLKMVTILQPVGGNSSTMVVDSLVMTITPSDGIISLGDTINIGSMLRKEPVINLITGFVEAFGLKIVTNEASKKVSMYHTTNVVLPTGEVPLSFYEKALTPLEIGCDEKLISFPKKLNTKLTIRFKKSTDGYIKSSNLDGNDGLYSFTIGKGERGKSLVNSYFEPTAMRAFLGGDINGKNAAIIPIMVDNEPDVYGNFSQNSFGIEPRMVMGYGNVYQGTTNNKIRITAETIPPLSDGGIDICFSTQQWGGKINGGTEVKKNLSYQFITDDLFDLLLHSVVNNQYLGAKIGYKKRLKTSDFFNFNFRKVYTINDGVGAYTGVVNSIVAHDSCDDSKTSLVVYKHDTGIPCGCNIPCDCSMTTCYARTDYHNETWDACNYAYNNNKDVNIVTSFVLNGVEQLASTLVALSCKSVGGVDINLITWSDGSTYATNLVDALNSLGIEFMTFGYAGNDDAYKNIMSMTYPSCWDFEIRSVFYPNTGNEILWKITPQGAKRSLDSGATWIDWYYYEYTHPACFTFNPQEQASSCTNAPTLLLEHATGLVQHAGQVDKILINTGGVTTNVDTDIVSYRRLQVSPSWGIVSGSSLDYCISSAYVTLAYSIIFQTAGYFYVQVSNMGRCDVPAFPLDFVGTIDGNGVVTNENQNGFTFLVNHAQMLIWGSQLDIIVRWNSPAGLAERKIRLVDTGAGNANYIDDVTFTETNISPTYNVEVKRETTYSDGCPQTLVAKTI